MLPETDIPLRDNQAYGHINVKNNKMEQLQRAIYVEPLETDIPLRDGHINMMGKKMEQIHEHEAIYEEPLEAEIHVPLRDNQAYGCLT